MLEFLFMLYLVSGSLKGILHAYGLEPPIDITMLTGGMGLAYALLSASPRNFEMRMSRALKERSTLLLGGFLLWMLASILWVTPSDEYVYWKGFAFLTNVVAFLIPLLNRSLRIKLFLKLFLGYALLYGLFNFFTYAFVRLEMVPVIGLEGEGLLERLYLKGGLMVGTAGILALSLRRPFGLLLLNFSIYLLLATGARAPILFFFIVLLAYLIRSVVRYIRANGQRIPFRTNSYHLRWGLGLLLGNLLLIGSIAGSKVLSAPYERAFFRYEVLLNEPATDEEGVSRDPARVSEEKRRRDKKKAKGTEPEKMGRLKEFAYVLDRVFERPSSFMWGYGLGSYNLLLHGEEGRNYPHNVLLEIWFELGAIGLVLAISFVASCILRMVYQKNIILLFAVFFYFMNTMKSLSMVDIRFAFGLLALGAFISAFDGLEREEEVEREGSMCDKAE